MFENPEKWTHQVEEVETLDDVSGGYAIVLYNDDVNTFDHVISCLIELCDQSAEQAEQSAMIVHFKGKCAVKHGGQKELTPICDALCRRDLSAVIEEI